MDAPGGHKARPYRRMPSVLPSDCKGCNERPPASQAPSTLYLAVGIPESGEAGSASITASADVGAVCFRLRFFVLNAPNRRVRTRTYGSVTGKAGDRTSMSIQCG